MILLNSAWHSSQFCLFEFTNPPLIFNLQKHFPRAHAVGGEKVVSLRVIAMVFFSVYGKYLGRRILLSFVCFGSRTAEFEELSARLSDSVSCTWI